MLWDNELDIPPITVSIVLALVERHLSSLQAHRPEADGYIKGFNTVRALSSLQGS